jgi:hypothetical protein
MNNQDFGKMISISNYKKTNKRKPQAYNYNYNESKCVFHQDLIFKLEPSFIGKIFNKLYENDISMINVEIWLEFEKSLSPLCKLKNLLDITKFAKIINNITKTEGQLINIWVTIHHNWFLHKSLNNHRTYANIKFKNKIKDFQQDHWFNRQLHRGYKRTLFARYVAKPNYYVSDILDMAREFEKGDFFEFALYSVVEANFLKAARKHERGKVD